MDKKWTKRGEVTEKDCAIIAAITGNNMISSRIFVTGEVYEEELGTIASSLLYAANDMLDEPLFVQTKEGTIQMARFDTEKVWRCFHPEKVEALVRSECARLGLPQIPIDEWDFYASMIGYLKIQYGEVTVPFTEKKDLDSFYQTVYLGCLWLFEKPGYMAVPVSRHFALPESEEWMKNQFKIRPLRGQEMAELKEIKEKYGSIKGITNVELNFLLKLHDEGR